MNYNSVVKKEPGHTLEINKRCNGIWKNWDLYLMLLFPTAFIIIFKYIPMYGVQLAFKDFSILKGIGGSPWVGFKYFKQFFSSTEFSKLIGNTVILSVYGLVTGLIFSLLLAFIVHYTISSRLKKSIQMITYAPFFISVTVMVGIIKEFFAIDYGPINQILMSMGLQQVDLLSSAQAFPHMYVWTGIWQFTGYGSIIYVATLAGVDRSLHESAVVDGANKWRRVWHIDIPSILPVIIIILILNTGSVLSTGFEKIFLMQNPLNQRTAEVIDTYVYKIGLASPIANYSYPTAIGLFQSLIGMLLIVITNIFSKKVGETSLW